MKALERNEIKEYNDVKIKWVPVPEWTKDDEEERGVFVKTLMADARDEWEYNTFVKGNEQDVNNKEKLVGKSIKRMRASLVVVTAVDEKGELLFTSEDIEWLGTKNAKAVDRIFEVAQKINGMRKGDLEDDVKNF